MPEVVLTPLVSLLFSGAALTEQDDGPIGSARVGCPVWGRSELLANLELRFGLPTPPRVEAVRVQQWSRRMAELEASKPGRFYARSFALDPLGTATTLLAWRDELVDAGWSGETIPDGGERLQTLQELAIETGLPPGTADRLRRLEDELRASPALVFDAIYLAESRALWPGRWQRVFALLEEGGTSVSTKDAAFEPSAVDTDLGRLQALLRGEQPTSKGLKGDGSIVVLRAETAWELGEVTAALRRTWEEDSVVIVRAGDARALDYALVAHGHASQGLEATSAWRPALQILPLALELAFEPRDPYRVLELLTLPGGPFQGLVGRELAGALAAAPGIGGPVWRAAKEKIAEVTRTRATEDAEHSEERVAEQMSTITSWFEEPGHPAMTPAPRAVLLAVAERVRAWLQKRRAIAKKNADADPTNVGLATRADVLGTAFAQAQTFHDALSHESRAALDLVDVRLLVEQVTSGHSLALAREDAGRTDHVDSPACLRRSRDVVVWWHCVAATGWRPSVRPWRRAELDAFRSAKIILSDAPERLAAESRAWHHPVHAAKKRLVLAIPRWALGEGTDPHPVWDEIVARMGATPAHKALVTIDASDLLRGRVAALGSARSPAVNDLEPLALPDARTEWRLDPSHLGVSPKHSASSLEALIGCPLKWVFQYRGDLRAGALASIPRGPLLSGKIGHRLVEELHHAGAFAGPGMAKHEVLAVIDRILREEAAVLLGPGKTFERSQHREELATSAARLAEVLVASKLTVVGVEVEVEAPWRAGALIGRLDVLLKDEKGREVVLDLKWGTSRYADLLRTGMATQLAVYAQARRAETKAREMPAAGYFSLRKGEVLAIAGAPFAHFTSVNGPSLTATFDNLERTAGAVEHSLRSGRALVTGVKGAVPLLDALGIDASQHERHLVTLKAAACTHCAFDVLCGKAWEGIS
jgi:ATP-dependent helicase/nuclease subunit B